MAGFLLGGIARATNGTVIGAKAIKTILFLDPNTNSTRARRNWLSHFRHLMANISTRSNKLLNKKYYPGYPSIWLHRLMTNISTNSNHMSLHFSTTNDTVASHPLDVDHDGAFVTLTAEARSFFEQISRSMPTAKRRGLGTGSK